MKVLVTGGTGVIGAGVIPALLRAGHRVRLLTRGAERDARRWPKKVEPFAADVSDPETLAGACDGCGAVVHITGIVRESPPRVTFERVNVGGTRHVLAEAERAGVGRFVLISSLGADRGASAYHRSKLKAEGVVRKFAGEWLVVRPGAVYGPGDEVISTLLKMVRALPAVPVVGQGDQRFQPVWYEDFGEAVARAVAMEGLSGQTLEVAGPQITTTDDLVERLGRITGREPARVPVPSFLASLGVRLSQLTSLDRLASDALNLDLPLDESKLTMLLEENFIAEAGANALTEVFHVRPTPLDDGLRALADSLPELLPSEGFGQLRRKRYWADIRGGLAPEELMRVFRERCAEVMPIEFDAEPGTPRTVRQGTTLTASLPARGHIQMRVAEAADTSVTFVTLEGHPLAGLVRFTAAPRPRGAVRFAVELHARAANALDFLTMSTLGSALQDQNWREVVARMVELSGGRAPSGVQTDFATLDDAEAEAFESWAETLVLEHQRAARKTTKRKATAATKTRAAAKKSTAKKVAVKNAAPRQAAAKKSAGTRRRASGREAAASVAGTLATVANAALSAVENLSQAAAKAARQPGKGRGRKR